MSTCTRRAGSEQPVDLTRAVSTTAGLTSSSLPPPNPVQKGGKKGLKGKKGLGSSNRRFKITNTHLKKVDLSKDFVPQSR